MKNYLVVVEVAVEYQGKFLVIKRPAGSEAGGLLSFPGGKVDLIDEQDNYDILRAAAKREILEEVGLNLLDPLHYVTSSFFVGTTLKAHVIDNIFHCSLEKTIPNVVPSTREVPEYYWLTVDEINNANNATNWFKKYVALIKA